MSRAVASLLALVLGLAGTELWLARRAAGARTAGRGVGMLFTPEEAARLRQQPALRVEESGATHAYGRIEGRWRCLSYHEAPADARAIQELLEGIAGAEGIVHARGTAEAPAYGINTPRTLRVSIQGPRAMQAPDGDVLATLELGTSTPSGGFARRKGTPEIWSIASDLRGALERRVAPGLPPLLEPAAVPSAWLEAGGALEITLEHEATRTVLARRDLPPDAATTGALPWRWILAPGPAERVLDAEAGEAFASYLARLPYLAVRPRAEKDKAGLAPPRAVVTLKGRSGAALRLEFGARASGGEVALWVEETLFTISARTFELALPAPEALAAEYPDEDPWSTALRESR
jgi:hypothetical protein